MHLSASLNWSLYENKMSSNFWYNYFGAYLNPYKYLINLHTFSYPFITDSSSCFTYTSSSSSSCKKYSLKIIWQITRFHPKAITINNQIIIALVIDAWVSSKQYPPFVYGLAQLPNFKFNYRPIWSAFNCENLLTPQRSANWR